MFASLGATATTGNLPDEPPSFWQTADALTSPLARPRSESGARSLTHYPSLATANPVANG
jgi:hypothetical protein